jgi:hypothetical protein
MCVVPTPSRRSRSTGLPVTVSADFAIRFVPFMIVNQLLFLVPAPARRPILAA